ncbi:hypothetical protein M1105_12125 [Limibaculum sp. FT325]|uniref:hypothetical protein n=1 Tax=Thermohalobaculum sediminis TaxID=2939436 RepID=UPI0020BE0DD6|nr:hypothetical protein [Limibaculum sediminis]MCL5777730.1 hypothetical protein [Limibaculum sediminis]
MQHATIDTATARRLEPGRPDWSPKGPREAAMIGFARALKDDPMLGLALKATRPCLAIFAIFVVIAAPFAGL